MTRFASCSTLLFAACASLSCPSVSQAQPFTYTRLAIIGQNDSSQPAINNLGDVTFRGSIGGLDSIYLSDGISVTNIIPALSGITPLTNSPGINNDGRVAFYGRTTTGVSVLTGTGGALSTIDSGTLVGANAFNPSNPLSITSSNRVVYAKDAGDASTSQILLGNGGNPSLIGSGGTFLNPANFRMPSVNTSGQVAYTRFTLLGSVYSVNLYNAGTTTQLINNSSTYSSFGDPVINDSGRVAMTAAFNINDVRILAGSSPGSLATLIDTSTSAYSGISFGAVAQNNLSQIAFLSGIDSSSTRGIYIGANPVTDKVIQTGDALDGSTVLALGFSPFGLNDSGEIAFYARLSNGQSGIYVANSTAVPEPSSIAFIGVTIAGCAIYAMRNIRRKPESFKKV